MKLFTKNILIGAAFTGLGLTACNDDFLNVLPPSQIAGQLVWSDPALVKAYVTGIYQGLQQGGYSEAMLAVLSDEAVFTHAGRNINTINEGSLNPSNIGFMDATYSWDQMFQRTRACNLVIEKMNSEESFDDEEVKKEILGQAYFLRAYFGHQLLRYYGSYPRITRTYALNENYAVPRNTFEECVNGIISDCDSSAALLEGVSLDVGRANTLAAKSLKSRVLLYAASDLHDIPTASKNSALISGYSNPEFLGYISGNQKNRWKAAQEAALEVIEEGAEHAYKLDLTEEVEPEEGTWNYKSIAMGGASQDNRVDAGGGAEIIFGKYYTPAMNESGRSIGLYNGPNGYRNWAGNTPIGLLVDDYQMLDGSEFSWTKADNKAKPYEDRDPRFYATILYDGADWKPRDLISGDVDPANQLQTGQYDLVVGGKNVVYAGLDTRSSSIEDWNGSRTGFYFHKFTDPNPAIVDNNMQQNIPWPFFRYTELVLNYVEASIELGDNAEAIKWLNRIRFRAGMPAITARSGNALRDAYRMERRIELVFEEHRYHDARRWMIAPETLGRKMTYINVKGRFKAGKTLSGKYRHDDDIYNYTYTPVTDNNYENRSWNDKMYYKPIDRNEMNRNAELINNPDYAE